MAKKNDLNDLLNAMEHNQTAGLDILQNYIGEYLKAYFVLGYDNNGDSVLIVNGKTEQDFDSIECLINRFSQIKFESTKQGLKNNDDEQ
tara:strand:+ start:5481 stop:5747 length:267 start_codon:yes stop_codon:yes gene_type:complete